MGKLGLSGHAGSAGPTRDVQPAGVPRTVGEAIRWGTQELQRAGVETPAVDSRLLMAYALEEKPGREEASPVDSAEPEVGSIDTKIERAAVKSGAVVLPRIPLSSTELFFHHDRATPVIFADWVAQRCQRTPLQHIVGAAVFDGVDYLSRPGAFVPRPETELLVEWAFHEALRRNSVQPGHASQSDERAASTRGRAPQPTGHTLRPNACAGSEFSNTAPITVVDLCTGPGTIALALACRFSNADRNALITGIELHEDALRVARENEAQLRHRGLINDRVELRFQRANVLSVQDIGQIEFGASPDVIVSNPPYVPMTATVSPEVLHDPADAVFAGEDGMDFLPGLLRALGTIAGGQEVGVGIEHDDANGPATVRALEAAGAKDVLQRRDITGRDRFVTGTWPGGLLFAQDDNPKY